jgi:hypothetical protein
MKDPSYGDGSRDQHLPFAMPRVKHATEERQKSAPIIGYALCPMHHDATAKRTGLQRIGIHIAFRDHKYRMGRQTIYCRASGVALCVAPPNDGVMVLAFKSRHDESDDGIRPGRCPHDATRK